MRAARTSQTSRARSTDRELVQTKYPRLGLWMTLADVPRPPGSTRRCCAVSTSVNNCSSVAGNDRRPGHTQTPYKALRKHEKSAHIAFLYRSGGRVRRLAQAAVSRSDTVNKLHTSNQTISGSRTERSAVVSDPGPQVTDRALVAYSRARSRPGSYHGNPQRQPGSRHSSAALYQSIKKPGTRNRPAAAAPRYISSHRHDPLLWTR
jgi:hypothetical protein